MRRLIWLVFVAVVAADLAIFGDVPFTGRSGQDHDHSVPLAAHAQTDPTCSQLPLGALEPARPTWCSATNSGPPTFVQGANSWSDDFNHGLSNASTGPGYRVFEAKNRVGRTQHFRHNNHWMVDVNGTSGPEPNNFGGAAMRPDRGFRFINGKLIVEADVAAGIFEYGQNAWPELTITTAPAPTARDNWGLYAYNLFPGHFTFGCILYAPQWIGCALLDDSGRTPEADEIWQASGFQRQGSLVFGGEAGTPDPTRPGHDIGEAWRVCRGTDPDINCRDRFRWEITKTGFTIYVNGTRYFEQSGLFPGKEIPDALVNGEVYVYFSSYVGVPSRDVVRFHWDRVSVNSPSASPPPGPTPTPTPVPVSCTPRPKVQVTTAAGGPGRLQVNLAAQSTSGVPNNRLRSIQVNGTTNAVLDIGGRTDRTGSFSVSLGSGVQQTGFTVRRTTPGTAMTVPFTVVDDCGPWQTFVGAGPNAP